MSTNAEFYDPMVPADAVADEPRFFDRFMFNMHPPDASSPGIIVGLGHYPGRDVADGYAIVSLPDEQRNVRFSTALSATKGNGVGPLQFQCDVPNQRWQLRLAENATGMSFDVVWQARTPYWLDVVNVKNNSDATTHFEHLVQSGRYTGEVTVDGVTQSVDGWYGQRDRSRGVRTMSGGQGLHIWFQAQFDDRSVGFLLVEGRDGQRMLLDGAVMLESGELDYVASAEHDLVFDGLDLVTGIVELTTKSGEHYRIEADASAGGGFMAGGGYGGHHGKPRGLDFVESDRYPLDGSVNQRTLDSSLTDRLTRFICGDQVGYGIFEFALSRSSSYQYRCSKSL